MVERGRSGEDVIGTSASQAAGRIGVADRRELSLADSHVAVWLGFSVINAGTILLASSATLKTRVTLSAFDSAQLIAVAGVGYLLLRLSSSRALARFGLLCAASIALGLCCLAPDFGNFSERHQRPELRAWLGVAAAMTVPLTALLGRLFARPMWRWLAVTLSALALAANHHVLRADYRGIHLLLALNATTFATAALVGTRLPASAGARVAQLRASRKTVAMATFALLVSSAALIVLPPAPVLAQAFRTEGSVFFPFLVGLHGDDGVGSLEPTTPGLQIPPAYLRRRDGLPPTQPSLPSLAPSRPIVIFVTIDAMRADVLANETWRRRLPRISGLVAESIYFSQARSAGSTTRNSLGQVFASKYSAQLRWGKSKSLGANLSEDPTPRLPNTLEQAGYTTIHLPLLTNMSGRRAIVGTFQHEKRLKAEVKGQRFALSEAVVTEALAQLSEHASGPTFLYMHWLDAHDPYDAAGETGEPFERYLRELELCDKSIGRLLDALRDRKWLDRVVLVLAADHGEALGAHGIPHHGNGLYDVLVRVPLLFRVPGAKARRIDVPVTTLDITPTLLDLLGLPTPGEYMGQSLVPFFRGQTPRLERPIALDESRIRLRGLIVGRYKIIDDKKKRVAQIYDLLADPEELKNLYGNMPAGEDARLLGITRGFFAAHDIKGENAALDD
jgi:glucan phosphoethanolaminetransferase (alkaline phosphatase superfamily)